MTTHDQYTELDQSTENGELTTEPVIDTDDHSLRQTDSSPAEAKTSTEQALFADHELSELQSRWADVQAAFVDDPKDSVQQADGLVSDVVEHITNNFSQARSQLEEQWSRGEDASTEDLRVALKQYREFFQRLLAVT